MTTTIPVQAKLAAAWTSLTFLYAYVDIFNFFKPGVLDSIHDGKVSTFDVSAPLLTLMLASVALPGVMVVLSMTLPDRMNRLANIVVAIALVPYTIFNVAGEGLEWAVFYAVSIGIEVILLAFILRTAWRRSAWANATTATPQPVR